MVWSEVLKSHKSDDWSTPIAFYDSLDLEFSFDFDPCPLKSDSKIALFEDWIGRVFCNPPYSNIYNFIEKGLIEIKKGNSKLIVYLLPSRTGSKWFHELVIKHNGEVRFIRGRLRFGNGKNSAPFDSIVVIFRGNLHEKKSFLL